MQPDENQVKIFLINCITNKGVHLKTHQCYFKKKIIASVKVI